MIIEQTSSNSPRLRNVALEETIRKLTAGEPLTQHENRSLTDYITNLESLALTDPLTRLENKRAFDLELEREIALTNRSEKDFSLAMFDLIGFKKINDTYGQDFGDKVIEAVGQTLSGRKTDRVYRIGGDEFAAIYTLTNQEGGILAAYNTMQMVNNMTFGTQKGALFTNPSATIKSSTDYNPLEINLRGAIITYKECVKDPNQIMPLISQGLCEAKNGGKPQLLYGNKLKNKINFKKYSPKKA